MRQHPNAARVLMGLWFGDGLFRPVQWLPLKSIFLNWLKILMITPKGLVTPTSSPHHSIWKKKRVKEELIAHVALRQLHKISSKYNVIFTPPKQGWLLMLPLRLFSYCSLLFYFRLFDPIMLNNSAINVYLPININEERVSVYDVVQS